MSTDLADDEVYCRDCGAVIKERAEICPECGIRQRDPGTATPEKSPGLAAVASFFVPGLGQVYNGEIAKGLVLMVVTIGLAITIIGAVLALPLWIWLIYDAYKVAERGGASGSSSGGASAPRTKIRLAFKKRIDEADDPSTAEEVKKRFEKKKPRALTDSDKEFIVDTVRRYDPDALPTVRDALGR